MTDGQRGTDRQTDRQHVTAYARAQNATACLIFKLTPRDHITPSLLQLHWLPVRWRIEYKLCCMKHSVHTRRCPTYLNNTLQLSAARQSRSDLRSSSTSAYLLPRLKTKFGERAFSPAGRPRVERTAAAHTHGPPRGWGSRGKCPGARGS